jgi:hypothetical protein
MGPGPNQQARHVIDAQEYQAVPNELVGQGYRLVFVSAFGSGNAAKYCAICRKNDGPDWEASRGQTADDFQGTMDDRRHQGYWLVHSWI